MNDDELILLEKERLRQMLWIAAYDIWPENPGDYLHDLSTRDYYEEIANYQKSHN